MDKSGRCFITEALSAIFMPKIEYRTSLLSNEERFFISDELCQGGFSMPNPTRISLPRVNYNFDAKACVPVLTVMLNKVEKDYSIVTDSSTRKKIVQSLVVGLRCSVSRKQTMS